MGMRCYSSPRHGRILSTHVHGIFSLQYMFLLTLEYVPGSSLLYQEIIVFFFTGAIRK